MSSNLLSIGASGANAAEIALQVTGENISNASTTGYVERSVNQSELDSSTQWGSNVDVSMSGVQVTGVNRNADAFAQAEVRRTAADTARANAEVKGLTNVGTAVEQSGVYDAINTFVGSLQSLAQNPTDSSSRAAVIQDGQTMTNTFQIAAQQLSSAAQGMQADAASGVSQINTIAQSLAQTNAQLVTSANGSSDQAGLLDQRDNLLDQLSQFTDMSTTIAGDGSVNVTVGANSNGTGGVSLVSGNTAGTMAMATATNGTIAFTVGGTTANLTGGSLAGDQLGLVQANSVSNSLDVLAANIASTVNSQQASGVDLSGKTGAALFSGTTAATLAMATTSGAAIATAAAGSAAGSADATNLTALNTALSTDNPASQMNAIIYNASGAVSSMTTTYDALKTISDGAATALSAQSGVNINNEAVNLVQYQQAFQASGQVMQAAETIFQTLMNIT